MNRKINVILMTVSIILIGLSIYFFKYTITNEASKNVFNIKEITNISYTNSNNSFYTNGKTFTFVIEGKTIYDKKDINLNKETGEIIKNTLYIRNVNSQYILIWYNEKEYQLFE